MFFFHLICLALSDVVRVEDFTSDKYFISFPDYVQLTEYSGRKCLKVQWTDESKKSTSHGAYYNFSVEEFAHYTLYITAYIASEDVSQPQQSFNGIKLMYVYNKNNVTLYPAQSTITYGTNSWTKVSFEIITFATDFLSDGRLFLGLQDSTGTVYFSNMTFEIKKSHEPDFTVPLDYQCEYTRRVTSRGRARGAMSPVVYHEEDFVDFKSWGGNIFRWQINSYNGDDNNLTQYNEWIDRKLDELELVLQTAQKLKLWIVIDLHHTPGGKDTINRMYRNETLHDAFIEVWRKIATRFKDSPMVWAYDLVNEPLWSNDDNIHYVQSQYNVANIIREIDPYTPIIVEFHYWPDSTVNYNYYAFPMKDIIYTVHIYDPSSYTHQGVGSAQNNTGAYPGTYNHKYYNKTTLESQYQQIIDFQNMHNAKIYVGEFSAILWAEGAELYIEDVIKIAEEHQWDWTYHAFREWDGWSVEHTSLGGERVETTPRKEVLLKYFTLNQDATEADNEVPQNVDAAKIVGITVSVVIVVIVICIIIIIFIRKMRNDFSS